MCAVLSIGTHSIMNEEFEVDRCQWLESRLLIRERSIGEKSMIGDAVPDYLLIEIIGESGMSTVWHAVQSSTGRDVAIKMLKRSGSSHQRVRDIFLRQAVITAELDHPHIIPVYDLARSESNELFCCMRHFPGPRWHTVINDKSLEENLTILLKVANAIAFAHFRGVVHSDIKPQRIAIGSFGEVQVNDFGHAFLLPHFRHYALFGQKERMMGGTPGYMAPEQVSPTMMGIGPWTDIYLLGANLFEIVTGRPPHIIQLESGRFPTPMGVLENACQNKIAFPESSNELLEISRKAMRSSPSDRYQSVNELIDAIKISPWAYPGTTSASQTRGQTL